MPSPLDFETQRDDQTGSWERADPRAALIERLAWNRWRVCLPDSEAVHVVTLETDHGAYLGACETAEGEECPGFRWHDGPCAHLCTVRKAAFVGVADNDGQPVRVFDREEAETERADPHVERVLADGGRRLLTDGGRSLTRTGGPAREPPAYRHVGGATTHCLSPRRLRIHDVVGHHRRDYRAGWSE